jgi:hypothetical protein
MADKQTVEVQHRLKSFIRDEILALVISGSFSRNKVYKPKTTEAAKRKLAESIKELLCEYAQKYKYPVSTEVYIKDVTSFADKISQQQGDYLIKKRLRIGTSQKLLGLYLKYLWALGWIQEPPACPFDRNTIHHFKVASNKKLNWTKLDDEDDYRRLITAAAKKAQEQGYGKNVAQWELDMFENRRSR